VTQEEPRQSPDYGSGRAGAVDLRSYKVAASHDVKYFRYSIRGLQAALRFLFTLPYGWQSAGHADILRRLNEMDSRPRDLNGRLV
jgi:hypothetical protein